VKPPTCRLFPCFSFYFLSHVRIVDRIREISTIHCVCQCHKPNGFRPSFRLSITLFGSLCIPLTKVAIQRRMVSPAARCVIPYMKRIRNKSDTEEIIRIPCDCVCMGFASLCMYDNRGKEIVKEKNTSTQGIINVPHRKEYCVVALHD
jgi:hypothetical protein